MNLDKNWWKILLGVWMSAVIVAAFLYARPVVKDLGQSVRILFFHVPCAWVATVAFVVSAVYSVLYLKKENLKYDVWAASSAEIGLIFTILATVTGAVWAAEIWGKAWNWDPRQISIFILMLIYAAYLALRSAVEEDDKRARLAAVYSIIASVAMVFFMFVAPRLVETLHPDPIINPDMQIKMESKIGIVFANSLAGFTLLFYWMLRLKVESLTLKRFIDVESIKE
jgi:heme exporter protein C